MHSEFSAKKVTVFVGETDRHQGRATYQALVAALREEGVSGVSVLRGILGYGESGHTHSAHVLDLADDLPICVVFVEAAEVVDRVLPRIASIVESGMTTVEDVRAIRYTAR